MKDIKVSVGSIIAAGKQLGCQSNVSSTPINSHLHFEVSADDNKKGAKDLINKPTDTLTTIMPYGYMDGIL